MNTLIAFAGKYGCTEKCANLVSEKLNGSVEILDLNKIKDVDIDKYEKLIIGGSLYFGKVPKEVSEFCSEYIDSLKGKRIGLFVCGMQTDTAEAAIKENFPLELLKISQTTDFFGGEFIIDKMNFMEKMIVKKIAKTKTNVSDIHEDRIKIFADAMNAISKTSDI